MSIILVCCFTGCSNSHYTKEGGEITTKNVAEVVTTIDTKETEETTENIEDEYFSEDIIDDSTIIDRTGSLVKIPDSINTIISTAPAVTEILSGLGLADSIIMADTFSADVEGIDASICTIDLNLLNIEALISAAPDVIFVSEINTDGTNDPYEQLRAIGTEVIYIPTSSSIQSIKDDISFIAEYTKTIDNGNMLIADIDSQASEISSRLAMAKIETKPSVYCELSAAPYLYSCGNNTFINEIITLCGGVNIYSDTEGWLSNSDESVISANPDIIITTVKYDGYDYNEVYGRTGWGNISAIKNNRIYQLDANSLSRPSQNIVNGMRLMAYVIFPELFPEYALENAEPQ